MASRAVGVIWGDGHLRPLTNAHLGAGKETRMSGDVQTLPEGQQEGHGPASAPFPVLGRSKDRGRGDRRGTSRPSEGKGRQHGLQKEQGCHRWSRASDVLPARVFGGGQGLPDRSLQTAASLCCAQRGCRLPAAQSPPQSRTLGPNRAEQPPSFPPLPPSIPPCLRVGFAAREPSLPGAGGGGPPSGPRGARSELTQ